MPTKTGAETFATSTSRPPKNQPTTVQSSSANRANSSSRRSDVNDSGQERDEPEVVSCVSVRPVGSSGSSEMDVVTSQNLISKGSGGVINEGADWGGDEFLNNDDVEITVQSTIAPSVIAAGSSIATTITVVTIVVIIIVAALFAMAIFIDYRQQTISERQQACIVKKRKALKLNLPHCRRIRQPSSIIEDAEQPGQSRPPLETITEVVTEVV